MCKKSSMVWINIACIYLKHKLSQNLPSNGGIWIQIIPYDNVKFYLNKTIPKKPHYFVETLKFVNTWGSLSDISSSMVHIFCACFIMESLSTPSGIDILDVLTN